MVPLHININTWENNTCIHACSGKLRSVIGDIARLWPTWLQFYVSHLTIVHPFNCFWHWFLCTILLWRRSQLIWGFSKIRIFFNRSLKGNMKLVESFADFYYRWYGVSHLKNYPIIKYRELWHFFLLLCVYIKQK